MNRDSLLGGFIADCYTGTSAARRTTTPVHHTRPSAFAVMGPTVWNSLPDDIIEMSYDFMSMTMRYTNLYYITFLLAKSWNIAEWSWRLSIDLMRHTVPTHLLFYHEWKYSKTPQFDATLTGPLPHISLVRNIITEISSLYKLTGITVTSEW